MIQKLVDKNCQLIFKYPLRYLSALILLTVFFGYFYSTLPTETSVESLIIEGDPDLRFYETFKEQFGEDEFLVVGFQHDQLFSNSVLSFIKDKTQELETIEEVKEVVSLTNIENIIGTDFDFTVRPLVEKLPKTQEESHTIKTQAIRNELIHNNIFSEKTDSALFLIRTESHPDDETYDARLITKVKQALENNPLNIHFHLAGWLVTDVSMSEYMAQDMMIFMPLTFGVIALLLWLFLRNIYAVGISLLTVTISLIWTMALLNIIGGAMSPMTSILSPLIMALIVSDCVHIFKKFLKKQHVSSNTTENIYLTLHTLSVPCFLTSLTTAIGFVSLGFSDIPPIRYLGIAAAGGMLIEFTLAITIIPLSIYALRNKKNLFQPQPQNKPSWLKNVLFWWGKNLGRYSKPVLVVLSLLIVISVYGLTNINVETNLLDYFKKGTPVRIDTDFFDQYLGGATTLEISIKSDQRDYFKNPVHLKMIEEIEKKVKGISFVTESTNINSFLKQMNSAFHSHDETYYRVPENRNLIAQYLLLYDGDELGYFINDEYNWARLSFRINEHSSKILKKNIAQLKNYLEKQFPQQNVEFHVTGKTYLVTKLVKSIVDSQTQSLGIAFAFIFICLVAIFKTVSIGLLSIIPNLFPIIINFGIMGLFGIPLNTATAIISAIAIGIAVDDTIHYLVHYQEALKNGWSRKEAVLSGITEKGGAIFTTSVILSGGFAILCFSSFVPTVQFGLLCSIIMVSALVGDLVLLPAVLTVFEPQSKGKNKR